MIDLAVLRANPEHIGNLLRAKEPSFDVQKLIELSARVRAVQLQIEKLRHRKNELADQAQAGITPELREQAIAVGKELKHYEQEYALIEPEFKALYLSCPNIPLADLPQGGKESNKVVRSWGQQPHFSFAPKHHLELGTELGWFDFERGALIASKNFPLYKGDGVKLIYALTMLMLDNNTQHGFEPMLPPVLVNDRSLEVASNFPKFKDQVYAVPADGLYLSPTSEVGLTNVYRNHVFSAQELPVRMTSWTSCFRREAGGYGATERGLIRIHQFEKVELYTVCEPQESMPELERMVVCAESILQQLGLHYRVSLLAMQDCSFPSAKTYDIEVWLPGQNAYYEVSSCSNCTDFQARRGLMRYKKTQAQSPELVHTLNASSLAIPRLMAALMEVYQQSDGSIALPPVLERYGMRSQIT